MDTCNIYLSLLIFWWMNVPGEWMSLEVSPVTILILIFSRKTYAETNLQVPTKTLLNSKFWENSTQLSIKILIINFLMYAFVFLYFSISSGLVL